MNIGKRKCFAAILGAILIACISLFVFMNFGVAATANAAEKDFYIYGSSLRYIEDDNTNSAIRFHVLMKTEKYNALNGKKAGVIIAAKDKLNGAELSAETSDDIKEFYYVETWTESDCGESGFAGQNGYMEARVNVYNVPKSQYGTELTVRAFTYDEKSATYEYTDEVSASLAEVAKKADEATPADGLKPYYKNIFKAQIGDGEVMTELSYGNTLTEPETEPTYADGTKYFTGWYDTVTGKKWDFANDTLKRNTKLEARFADKEAAKVIVLAGQSNAVGFTYASHLSEEDRAKYAKEVETVKISYSVSPFGGEDAKKENDGKFVNVRTGYGRKYDKGDTFGPEVGLAEYLNKNYPNETFYIIKTATGGSTLHNNWYSPSSYEYLGIADDADLSKNLYNQMLSYVDRGMATLSLKSIPEIVSFMWMQGENDGAKYYQDYSVLWNNFVSDLKTEWGSKNYLPSDGMSVIQGGITKRWGHYNEINFVKKQYANVNPDAWYIDVANADWCSYTKDNDDVAHHDATSMLALGKAFGETLKKSFNNEWAQNNAPIFNGNGTEETPYLIENIDDLMNLHITVNLGIDDYNGKYFRQTENIDLTPFAYTEVASAVTENKNITLNANGWFGIGTKTNSFKGVYDGTEKTITLKITSSDSDAAYHGVFGNNAGTIKNVIVNGSVVSSQKTADLRIAGVVGNNSGTVTNCKNYAEINAPDSTSAYHLAGVVGYNTGNVTNCENHGKIGLEGVAIHTAGGVIGLDHGSAAHNVTDCRNYGNVYGSFEIGGVIGRANNNLTASGLVNEGTITGNYRIGGVFGLLQTDSTATDCVNGAKNGDEIDTTKGLVIGVGETANAKDCAGGIIGAIFSSTVKNCVNYANITSKQQCVGGIFGLADSVAFILENCENRGEITGSMNVGGIFGRGIGKALSATDTYIKNCKNYANVKGTKNVTDKKYRVGGIGGSAQNIYIEDVCVYEGVSLTYFVDTVETTVAITSLTMRFASAAPFVNVLFGYGKGGEVKDITGTHSGICDADGKYLRNTGTGAAA